MAVKEAAAVDIASRIPSECTVEHDPPIAVESESPRDAGRRRRRERNSPEFEVSPFGCPNACDSLLRILPNNQSPAVATKGRLGE